jgi:cob(I)alamin adenosyltransferase
MKLYTRKGDSGQTSIWGGRRLGKDEARTEAMGGRLFVVGSELMAPDQTGAGSRLPRLAREDVAGLETAIDALWETLPELRNFILPGGAVQAAELHVARAACRRAERRVTTLSRAEDVPHLVPAYLNRLADLLFAAARYANSAAGVADAVWSPGT